MIYEFFIEEGRLKVRSSNGVTEEVTDIGNLEDVIPKGEQTTLGFQPGPAADDFSATAQYFIGGKRVAIHHL